MGGGGGGPQIGNNHQADMITHQKVTTVKKQMEGIGKVIEGEVSKVATPVAQRFEAEMHDGTKVDVTLPMGPSKGESSASWPQV